MSESNHISFEQIKALAENKLSAEETKNLREKIKGHPKWEPIYEGLVHFQQKEAESVDDFLNTHKNRFKTPQKGSRVKSLVWVMSSAAAIILVVLLVARPWERDLSQINFQDAGLPTTLSSSENSTFNQAMVAFKQGNFDQSLSLFEQVQENKIGIDTLLYFKATCQKEMGHYQKALGLYQEIDSSSAYFEKAEYQMALSSAFAGDEEIAITGMKAIAEDSTHLFSDEAKKALKVLE